MDDLEDHQTDQTNIVIYNMEAKGEGWLGSCKASLSPTFPPPPPPPRHSTQQYRSKAVLS